MKTNNSIQEGVDRVCRSCHFGYRVAGEIYTRCSLDKDESCPEQDRIDETFEDN